MKTIVVIDDDDIVRDLLVRILQRVGYQVLEFDDAQPALEEIDFTTVDLIITDLSMPTNGEVVVQTLHRKGIQTPLIVLTGYVTEEKAQYLVGLGARTVMRKPFNFGEFVSLVQTMI